MASSVSLICYFFKEFSLKHTFYLQQADDYSMVCYSMFLLIKNLRFIEILPKELGVKQHWLSKLLFYFILLMWLFYFAFINKNHFLASI